MRRSLVTGAARGIGEAVARAFIREGATVLLTDIRDEEGEKLAGELGPPAEYRHLDVTDDEAWRKIGEEAAAQPLDVLVNNAGAVVSFDPLREVSPATFREIVELNLTSVVLGMRFVIPTMVSAGSGSVINLSSISGVVGHDVAPAYQAAPMYDPWREDYELFRQVRVDPRAGTIEWPNGADISPRRLYAESKPKIPA